MGYYSQRIGESTGSALGEILKKAAKDANFRKQLLVDPVGTVARETGLQMPKNFRLKFIENVDADVTIVLPGMVANEAASLDQHLASTMSTDIICSWSDTTDPPTCIPADVPCPLDACGRDNIGGGGKG